METTPRAAGPGRHAPHLPKKKWGPALLPAPTAPSEGFAGVRSTLVPPRKRFATPLLDPGSPAQASLLTEQLPLARSPINLLDCAARRFAGRSIFPARRLEPKFLEAKTTRCSAALLGETALASRFAHHGSEEPGSRVAREAIPSSGASSRLAPTRTRGLSPLPAGGDRTFGHLPHPLAVSGSWGGRDRRPDHPSTMHFPPESGKRKIRLQTCGKRGYRAQSQEPFRSVRSARFGCRSVLLRLPRERARIPRPRQ